MARTTTRLLLTGDYADRLNAAYSHALDIEQRMEKARQQSEKAVASKRVIDVPDHKQLEALYEAARGDYEALKAEAEAEAIKVTLRAVGRKEWRALRDKHPPRRFVSEATLEAPSHTLDREVEKQDRLAGVNVDTVEDDLVAASLVEPAFSSRAQFDEWADALSEAEFQTILSDAWALANTVRTDPKSLPVSLTPTGGQSDR